VTDAGHFARNLAYWNATADDYQTRHGEFLDKREPAWGVWQIPERELNVLGDVAGKDVLELGCGAAQWSILLARAGARAVGLDASIRQLAHARALVAAAGVVVPLVLASAEATPLADATFDIVFCDYGAMTFTDPALSVPEAARMLRPGGLFAFSQSTPVLELCWPLDAEHAGDRLVLDYFSMRRLDDQREGSSVFQIPYGEWVRLFRRCGLVIEDLIETRPPADATSTYRSADDLAWARRWPAEQIWKLRRDG
jgi:SAM-dependent methyltransferase